MSFSDLDIASAYETLVADPIEGFYVPVLREAVGYDRIAGFFTSSSLALAARGIAGLIRNGGTMRLVVSPKLNPEDVRVIQESGENPLHYIERSMIDELDNLEASFEADHVRALGWMLARGLLQLKIACVIKEGEVDGALFHQKVGILKDSDGNRISFSGSVNETAAGWLFNSEEFKVFKSWVPGEEKFLDPDVRKFDELWAGERPHVKIFEPSEALRRNLVELGEGFDVERIAVKKYRKQRAQQKAREKIPLFFYQQEAVDCWEKHGRRLLFEMATGTGKTRTAIACVNLVKETEGKLLCVVAAPEVTLARQWEGEFEKLGVRFDALVYADSSSGGKAKWKPLLERYVSRMKIGRCNSLLVLTTHDTACSPDFTLIVSSVAESVKTCLVGDEVHGMGSRIRRSALLDRYDYRIGLSATPSRWFDDSGTQILLSYFGDASYAFSIRDAQQTINPVTGETFLTPYVYRAVFVRLDEWEMDEYLELTAKMVKLSFSDDGEGEEARERLLMKRADIVKNAKAKLPAFAHLVRTESMDKTLVFTSPQQIDEVCEILGERRIASHRFTMKQGTRKSDDFGGRSEREHILELFKDGTFQALVAISCLDEGIDIPIAEKAILLSSSTNPREYIQRIGRVIRRYPGKQRAYVYDFIVEPDWGQLHDPDMRKYELRIFEKEMRRVKEMAGNAENSTEVLFDINERLEKLYGLQ